VQSGWRLTAGIFRCTPLKDKRFNMWKKFAIIGLTAMVHFGLSILVVSASIRVATAANPVPSEPSPVFRVLVMATRVLHFPIITLSLYSRQWFPGSWIYVPILINSFLWAAGLYLLFLLVKKIGKKADNGKGNH
jgi:hypothetical protein